MSVLNRYPFIAGAFVANSALAAVQTAATIAGADSLYGVAVHGVCAAASGAYLHRHRIPSTERKALQDQRARERAARRGESELSSNTADAAVKIETELERLHAQIMLDFGTPNSRIEELGAKFTANVKQLKQLGGDVEQWVERAQEFKHMAQEELALREIMYGPHSTYGQTQAIIDRIDAELRAMEHAEWDRRKAEAAAAEAEREREERIQARLAAEADAKREAERLAAMTPEERAEYEDWAEFGGPPRRLGSEELAEIRERVRPVGDGDTVDLMTWGQVEAIKTLHLVPPPLIGTWSLEELAQAVGSGRLSRKDARQIIALQRAGRGGVA